MGDHQPNEPPPPLVPTSDTNALDDGGNDAYVTSSSDEAAPKVVTVYASSSSIVSDAYKKLAFSLGEHIAAAGWVQLNGGGSSGLMGAATAGGLSRGGTVNAVILDVFTKTNMHAALGSVQVVQDMSARKAGLYAPAAAYVALPGGLGTLEELAEVLSWRQLGFHARPIVLLGSAYWRPLVEWVRQAVEQGFVSAGEGAGVNAFAVVDTPEDAIQYIRTHKPLPVDKAAMYSSNFAAAPSTVAVVSTVPTPAGAPPVAVHADWTVVAGAAGAAAAEKVAAAAVTGGAEAATPTRSAPPPS
ncbi:hypothetical protein MMPV_009654 [Pyropia vietnamensis]